MWLALEPTQTPTPTHTHTQALGPEPLTLTGVRILFPTRPPPQSSALKQNSFHLLCPVDYVYFGGLVDSVLVQANLSGFDIHQILRKL